ncbi:hypothetical protein LCGC14_2309220 [marine sediment metagenome]|uniref:Homing endonuclease LAGLIDADG domain-containing protein n=1 Tax=marine sediment metagenome TaxID=412755 RepID=A0A0F9CLN0_9ZZZZ
MIKTIDIAWLGGLLEAEGWFGFTSVDKYPAISIAMTDEDIIVRVSDMWNTRVTRNRNKKVTKVNGSRAIMWMMTLFPFFGRHRKDAIIEVIKGWRGYRL